MNARYVLCTLLLAGVIPASVAAQEPRPAQAGPDDAPRLWLVGGGAFATLRGACQECEADYPYRHTGSILVDAGYRVNRRMEVAAELFWVPADTASGQVRTTHIDAIAQFRPWASKGFFVKGGAGMAFVRNWVDVADRDPITSKALSIVIGTGWEFRATERVGFQIFASQHAAALGDFKTASADAQDVMANFWSIGAAIVIR